VRLHLTAPVLVTAALAVACGGGGGPSPTATPGYTPAPEGEAIMTHIALTSGAFQDGGSIPYRYTCNGDDVSPPLAWGDPPPGTRSFALLVDDPDAPRGTFTHWVLFNIPSGARGLPEGVPGDERLPDGSVQGRNDFPRTGWGGPCPPSGTHRYRFFLYALDATLDLPPGASKRQLLDAVEDHILAEGRLTGTYSRR